MYKVPEKPLNIRLIDESKNIWEYRNLEEAAKELFKIFSHTISSHIGDHFNAYRGVWYDDENQTFHKFSNYPYILRTELGDIVSLKELREALPRHIYRWERRDALIKSAGFRQGPVPRTGKRRWRFASFYRRPKTRQEIKESDSYFLDEDMIYYNIKSRAKRSSHSLPSSWDDVVRSDYGLKNWKNYRKTQWKKE